MFAVRGALVYTSDFVFEKKNILVEEDKISGFVSDDELELLCQGNDKSDGEIEILNVEDAFVIPGLVDIHLHGAMNCDFCDGSVESIRKIAAYEGRNGVLSLLPTTMSLPKDRLEVICESIADYMESDGGNSSIECCLRGNSNRYNKCFENSKGAQSDCCEDLNGYCRKSSDCEENLNGYCGKSNDCEENLNGYCGKSNDCEENLNGYCEKSDDCEEIYADILGINLEGPFINPNKAGAQNKAYICPPDLTMIERLQECSRNNIRLIDLAPELQDAMELIKESGITTSVAHTDADYDTCMEAFESGCSHVTHLFNAMPGLDKRNPGPIAAAKQSGAYVELIADGGHVHPAMVSLSFDLFGDDRIVLISDSMEATGLPDGEYHLGGQSVQVTGNKALLSDGLAQGEEVIAGSVTNLFDCMKTAVMEMGIPMESAIRAATYNPAASVGMEEVCGVIDRDRKADFVIIDKDFNILYICKEGKVGCV